MYFGCSPKWFQAFQANKSGIFESEKIIEVEHATEQNESETAMWAACRGWTPNF
jgi:hypothetical protein